MSFSRANGKTSIAFENLDKSTMRIPESIHASLPFIAGVKYVLTIYESC